ncbi:ABC transporter ATP-binding protein [Micromonospora craniellae]|uniref:ABC transporter ATP-binding protein n=1 Tax=Micromonospora craniellae TaxID=2294034 RepID=A0A372G3D9_9ACTN|nr:ABC transporter ATP-binding protein [Micromonospora craniellae]QOC91969.1 ABC transporter ATP-binding protein [Micromonospora craniellae]RFS47567.1 ABC transporter ATP-binding protein [Micromonospora craniellae]
MRRTSPPVPVTAPEPLVSLDRVRKSFPLPDGAPLVAVNDVSLSLAAGSAVALTGPSGSGKSTLLHLIGAIERSDAGTIDVAGQRVTGLSGRALAAYRRRIGFVFQRFHLLPTLTALDNVMAPLIPFRTDFDKAARARELLAMVGLADRTAALPSRLSGGQQQRVAIARALINRPVLLLADEPTGNLDSQNGTAIVDLRLSLRDEHGTTLVMATHDPGIAARCDRTVHLRDGRLTSLDSTDGEPGVRVG